jgi:enamine deaminase RidA (YjgF/YER057c/UK114 family)
MDQNRRDLMARGVAAAAGAVAAGTAMSSSASAQAKPDAPRYIRHDPPRPYAKAVVVGNMIYLAGEDSKDPKTQRVQGATAGEQTEITFQNIKATLEGLGSSLDHVIKLVTYLKDPRDRAKYGPVAGKYVPHAPVGTLIMGVQLAEPEMLVEIEAIAVIPG